MPSSCADLPPYFYRAHHKRSFTIYDPNTGFDSAGYASSSMNNWLCRRRIERHLNWRDRSSPFTPFISVFDNEDDATDRAEFYVKQGRRNVFVATIDTECLYHTTLDIDYGTKYVELPAWHDPNDPAVIFLSTPDLRYYLDVDTSISQESEWLAVDCIPDRMIVDYEHY